MASTSRENERLKPAMKVVEGSGEVRFGDRWRARERPFPTDAGPVCVVVEFHDSAAGWLPKFVFNPDGTFGAP